MSRPRTKTVCREVNSKRAAECSRAMVMQLPDADSALDTIRVVSRH